MISTYNKTLYYDVVMLTYMMLKSISSPQLQLWQFDIAENSKTQM